MLRLSGKVPLKSARQLRELVCCVDMDRMPVMKSGERQAKLLRRWRPQIRILSGAPFLSELQTPVTADSTLEAATRVRGGSIFYLMAPTKFHIRLEAAVGIHHLSGDPCIRRLD